MQTTLLKVIDMLSIISHLLEVVNKIPRYLSHSAHVALDILPKVCYIIGENIFSYGCLGIGPSYPSEELLSFFDRKISLNAIIPLPFRSEYVTLPIES